jgi:outer membrane protein assembly factor BamB
VLIACVLTSSQVGVARAEPEWSTYHRDAQRSGYDPEAREPIEPVLAWHTANLGAPIWGQPLVLGSHVYVATVGDEIYELNASTGAVEWEKSAGAPVPSSGLPCGDITPTVGIVGTPVIDASRRVIYAVADTWNGAEAEHVLKGYALSDGEEVLSIPVDPPGADPKALLQRTALNLDNGSVIFGFGGNDGDCGEYRGTVVAAPENGGEPLFWQYQPRAPSVSGGAVWAASGPAVSSAGEIYAATGNPNPSEGTEVSEFDYSDSLLRLDPTADLVAEPSSEPNPRGWFEPPTWMADGKSDADLGSAGPELLPGGTLFQAGKNGTGYLVEAGMQGASAVDYEGEVCGGAGSFGGDAYASGTIYIPCTNGVQALSYNQKAPSFTPRWRGPEDAFGSPIVSGGLVWVLATGGFEGGGETLYGLDQATGATRYSEHLPSPLIDHFAGGRLFVSSGESVTAYQIAHASGGPTGSPTGSPTSTTSPNVGQATPPARTAATASAPTLVHTHLHVGRGGRVRLTLRCPARSAGGCRGTVTLIAEIAVTGRKGRHRVRRVVAIALARARFGPHTGDFAVVLRLGRGAEAHLRRHHHRLNVRVVISSPGSRARQAPAVLT